MELEVGSFLFFFNQQEYKKSRRRAIPRSPNAIEMENINIRTSPMLLEFLAGGQFKRA